MITDIAAGQAADAAVTSVLVETGFAGKDARVATTPDHTRLISAPLSIGFSAASAPKGLEESQPGRSNAALMEMLLRPDMRARVAALFLCCFGLLMSYLNLRDLYLLRYQSQALQGRVVSLATSQNAKGNVHRLVEFSYRCQDVEAQDSAYASESQMAGLHKDGPVDIVVIPSAEQCFFYSPKAVLAPEPDTFATRAVIAGWLALAVAALSGFLFCIFGWSRIHGLRRGCPRV